MIPHYRTLDSAPFYKLNLIRVFVIKLLSMAATINKLSSAATQDRTKGVTLQPSIAG